MNIVRGKVINGECEEKKGYIFGWGECVNEYNKGLFVVMRISVKES